MIDRDTYYQYSDVFANKIVLIVGNVLSDGQLQYIMFRLDVLDETD